MINTYVLMIIGVLMVGAGCLFWAAKSIKNGEQMNLLFFLVGVAFCSTFLFALGKGNNIFTCDYPSIIILRIIIFILGLLMIFTVLFRHDPIMDKIQRIFDKFKL